MLFSLSKGKAVSRRYRNRRIGEFLKELDLTEGRSTGISKILRSMKENGSLEPEFETDEDRSYFLIRLLVRESQPELLEYRVLNLLVSNLLGKASISKSLGQKKVSGQLNKVIRELLQKKFIEYTIPENPNSRLQKYRLTTQGKAYIKDCK